MEPNEDYDLRRVLREWEVPGGSPDLERRVMARRGWRWSVGWRPQLLFAATSAALMVIGALLSGVPAPRAKPQVVPGPLLTVDGDAESPFVPVPYSMPLDSYETGMVLRMNVPVAALIAAGYRIPVADPTAIVVADVLVGDDGRAHAVRLVSGASAAGRGD